MIFDKNVFEQAGFTQSEIETFERMNTGGKSGRAGYDYQDLYAVHRLILATADFLQSGKNFGAKEQERCPVDDLVFMRLSSKKKYEFCQLKTNANTSWGYQNGKLCREFIQQKKLCEHCGLDFLLQVVTPLEDRHDALIKKLPLELRACTEIVLYPLVDTISGLSEKDSPTRTAIEKLVAFDQTSPEKCRTVAVAFFSVWIDQGRGNHDFLFISDMFPLVLAQYDKLPIRQNVEPPVEWEHVQRILQGIQDLKVYLTDGICHYQYKWDSGQIGRQGTEPFDRFMARIMRHKPKDFESFWELLP